MKRLLKSVAVHYDSDIADGICLSPASDLVVGSVSIAFTIHQDLLSAIKSDHSSLL